MLVIDVANSSMPSLARLASQHRHRGFTLLELMVTISIAAVLVALAAPSFVKMRRNSELTTTANTFVAAMSAARAEAMSRQLNTLVRPTTSDDWAKGWEAYVDVNFDFVRGAGDVLVTTQTPLAAGITATNDPVLSDSSGHYVMFSGSGFVMSAATGSPTAITQSVVFTQTATGEKRRVIINSAGRLRVCDAADTATCVTASDL